MKISALIVDDEQPARDELAFLLKGIPDIEVVGQGKNGVEAVNLIRELTPQVVFLDVQMPGLDGFGVIKKLLEKKVPLPFLVFATAYDQYAVQAFEVNAIDYLLKPIARSRLEKAIARVRRGLESVEHSIFPLYAALARGSAAEPRAWAAFPLCGRKVGIPQTWD
jgi:two-component system LytT family response regulator/two-component system response regulator LytT